MMQTTLGVDVLGVVQPGAVQAVAATRNGRIGVMATPATVASGAYAAAIAAADPFVDVTSIACPDLTRIIEAGFPFDQRVVDTVRGYCAPLREAGRGHGDPRLHALPARAPDAPALPRPRAWRSSPPARPSRARSSTCSARAGSGSPQEGEGDYSFLCNGDAEAFRALGTRFLQLPLGDVETVRLADEQLAGSRP